MDSKPGHCSACILRNRLLYTGLLNDFGTMNSGRKIYQVLLLENIFQRNFPKTHFDLNIRPAISDKTFWSPSSDYPTMAGDRIARAEIVFQEQHEFGQVLMGDRFNPNIPQIFNQMTEIVLVQSDCSLRVIFTR